MHPPDVRRVQRRFGLIVGAGFAVIAAWPLIFGGRAPRTWALVVSLVLVLLALAAPAALKPAFRVWMAVGEVLGWVNTRIILSAVYCLLIVPIGLVRRLTGDDPMRRRFDSKATTYLIPRHKRPPVHMRHQY